MGSKHSIHTIPSRSAPNSSAPLAANFPSPNIVLAAGVAIFHLATARVVICRHPHERHHFLPKGRKNASEGLETAAVREGFEESGYRCRLLPLPVAHRQPVEDSVAVYGGVRRRGEREVRWEVEAVWTQMVPFTRTVEYVLLWYVGETLDGESERRANEEAGGGEGAAGFVEPERWGRDMTVEKRKEMDRMEDGGWYEPVRHLGTGVDEDERMYEAKLVPVEEGIKLLGNSVMADVVRQGWDLVRMREELEDSAQTKDG